MVVILLKHENDGNYLKNWFFFNFSLECWLQYAKYSAHIKRTCNNAQFEPLVIAVIAILIIWHQIKLDIWTQKNSQIYTKILLKSFLNEITAILEQLDVEEHLK